ncbi:hypothetical protein UFOVP1614_11 [uncultured Caudovirales phage]|uniref:Uncharacterized protein n=1 Tax=uncultured Caudovirales phage TaxID=2100421 RepID=A0A6J5MPT9_9CAUD|nr:hypothetical protein UFOVP508_11 [uncultured Caudovirales phage]CAB4178031.1 hypothetical protein UFOVP1012_18 [uncultured Caudovirales phage]CAB4187831.1 hypothetical protein UFOVP1164_13 [uncultured Caudovirales phage]CAB4219354.1 hypothetical protein UFOVP1614_11 [uncultured Caudovirales phage]
MTPDNILRYLEHGYVMKLEEQIETAEYIRQLQQSNEVLLEGMIELADTIFRLRQLQEARNKNERT